MKRQFCHFLAPATDKEGEAENVRLDGRAHTVPDKALGQQFKSQPLFSLFTARNSSAICQANASPIDAIFLWRPPFVFVLALFGAGDASASTWIWI